MPRESSLPMFSFTAGHFSIARLCFQHVSKLFVREKSRQQRRRGWQARSTSFTCSRIITKTGPNRALVAGASAISLLIRSAKCSPALLLHRRFRIYALKMSGHATSIGFGGNRKVSTGSVALNGCLSHVRVVRKEKSILADAVVRRRC